MEIKQLKYFIEVAKREHLSDAALELNIAQSAISRQITLIEKDIHVTSFCRSRRNINITKECTLLSSEATIIIEQPANTARSFNIQSETDRYFIPIGYVEMYITPLITL